MRKCKYCNNATHVKVNIPVSLGNIVNLSIDEMVDIYIPNNDGNKHAFIFIGTYNTDDLGNGGFHKAIDIAYCPFCGRKLGE